MIFVATGFVVAVAAGLAMWRAGVRSDGRVAGALVVVAAIVAAVAAAAASGEPTVSGGFSAVLRVALAVVLVVCGAQAQRWPLLAASVPAVAISLAGEPHAAAGVALGAALVHAIATDPRYVGWSPYGAASGAALSVAVLRFEWPDPTGMPSLAAAVIVLIVVVPVWWDLGRPWRGRIAAGAALVAVVGVLAVGAAAWVALEARSDLEAAVDAARAGLDAIDDISEREAALAQLRDAEQRFADANDRLASWWARPVDLVPVAGQQVDAVRSLSDAGERLSSASASALESADPERLRIVDGSIDLDALATSADALSGAVRELRTTRAELDDLATPWLVDRIDRERAELATRIDDVMEPATNAADGAQIARTLLGADGPKRYLLLMITNSESRGVGGWYGSYGVISADAGRLELERIGRTGDELVVADPWAVDAPSDFVERYSFAYDGPGDVRTIAMTPDFATAGRMLADAYEEIDPRGVDGVMAVDPYGLQALLRVTGPVQVASWPDPIGADNVVPVLLHEQYAGVVVSETGDVRGDFQAEVADAVWRSLVDGDLAPADELVDALAPAVRGRRVQVFMRDQPAQDFFTRVDAAGAVGPLEGDYIGVVTQNLGGNKIDWYLRREVSYSVRYDPGRGTANATLRVVLHNDAPVGGVSPLVIGSIEGFTHAPGVNRSWFNLYTALEVQSARVDGAPLTLRRQRELGRNVASTELLLEPGTSTVLEFDLAGELRTLDAGGPYVLDVLGQPVVGNDLLTVDVAGTGGWSTDGSGQWSGPQEGSVRHAVDLEASD